MNKESTKFKKKKFKTKWKYYKFYNSIMKNIYQILMKIVLKSKKIFYKLINYARKM